MTVAQIPEQTSESLYRQQRALAEFDETPEAWARGVRERAKEEQSQPESPETLETPGMTQGLSNAIQDLSLPGALGGFFSSVAHDAGAGLRMAFTPGEAVSNAILSQDTQSVPDTFKAAFLRQPGPNPAQKIAENLSDDPANQIAIATGLSAVTDPMILGTAGRGAFNGLKGIINGARQKTLPMTALAKEIAGGDQRLIELARQADGGSRRAATKLMQVLDSDAAAPLMKQWDQNTLKKDHQRLFSVGGKGIPTPKKEVSKMVVYNYHRREGNPVFLMDELANGPKYSPYKHTESYLSMNSPDSIQRFNNVYIGETRNYIEKSLARATPEEALEINMMLRMQPTLLQKQMGNKLNANLDPVEAFAARRLLSDLAATAKKQVHPTEMKFRSNIDYLRFWKVVSAREALRQNLAGEIPNEAGSIMGMLSTYADGPATQVLKADRAILRLPQVEPTSERRLAKALGKLDGHEAEMFLNQIFPKPGLDKQLHRYWMNSLLSSPITHSRNIFSNLGVAMMRPASELGAIPVAIAKGQGGEAMIHLRRAREMTLGIADVAMDSVRLIARQPSPMADNLQMFKGMHEASITRPRLSKEALANASVTTRSLDYIASILPVELLGKTDSWFKSLTYRADVRANAAETASRLTRDASTRRSLTKQLINDPLELAKAEAFRASERATFQNPLPEKIAETVATLRKFAATKWIVPFVSTPYNVAMMGIRHTPFAPVLKSVRDDLASGGQRADLAAARMALPAFTGLGAVMMFDDRITGADNQRLRLNQNPPYSIRIGKDWLSYEKIEPLRWVLGPIANLRDLQMATDWDSRDGEDQFNIAVSGFVGAFANVALDNFWMFQLTTVLDSARRGLEDNHWQGLMNVAGQTAQGFMPSGVTWANRTFFDKNMRELDTFSSRLANRTPGLSMSLPPKVGLLGEPQTHADQLMGIIPMSVNPASDHPIYGQIQLTGATIPDVPKVVAGVKLNAAQRATLRVMRANPDGAPSMAYQTERLINSPSYRAAGPEGKAEYITSLISKYNILVGEWLYNNDASLRQAAVLVRDQEMQRRGR